MMMKNALQQAVKEEVEKSLYLLDEKVQAERVFLMKHYRDCVMALFNVVEELQARGKIYPLSVLWIVLSRTAIDNQDFHYPVFAYDEKMELKFPTVLPSVDVSFFYEALQDSKRNAFFCCKKYVKENFILPEVEQELYRYLQYFNMYFVTILREVFQTEEVKQKIKSTLTVDCFQVLQGEVGGKPYCIYEKKLEGDAL